MKFLPPNVTALIKPMDQRVIKTTKRLYRKKLIVFLLEQQEANPLVNFMDLLKKVTIKTVLYLAAEGWEGIKKHFKKVGKNCDLIFLKKTIDKMKQLQMKTLILFKFFKS
jgi:hypothetical protein